MPRDSIAVISHLIGGRKCTKRINDKKKTHLMGVDSDKWDQTSLLA